MEISEKWFEVKIYYERSYKNLDRSPVRFKSRPSDEQIEMLYQNMKKLGACLGAFYEKDIGLLHRLEALQGLTVKQDPVRKRKPFE